MKKLLKALLWIGVLVVLAGAGVLFAVRGIGVSARPEPGSLETRAALFLRSWLTPPTYKGLKNPLTPSEQHFADAREHFADHCASCHANNGSGDTEMGRSFYPKTPDMRLPRTQQLSDGELFYFIEHGIRLTGMPGWSTGTPEGERSSWQLVHFIRRLPTLTPEDLAIMEAFNPTSRQALDEERKIDEFLSGADPASQNATPPDPHAGHKPPK